MRFWDSSALVPLFVLEERSPILEALVADDPDMVVWWASPVECGPRENGTGSILRIDESSRAPADPAPPGRGEDRTRSSYLG